MPLSAPSRIRPPARVGKELQARVEKELPVLSSRPHAAGAGGAGGRPGKGGMGDRERRENGRERERRGDREGGGDNR